MHVDYLVNRRRVQVCTGRAVLVLACLMVLVYWL